MKYGTGRRGVSGKVEVLAGALLIGLAAAIGIISLLLPGGAAAQPPAPQYGDPPLRLQQSAPASAAPGDALSVAVTAFSTSTANTSVEVQVRLSDQLEVTGARTAGGACRVGTNVSCTLTARADQPATITIGVVVGQQATAGTSATIQTLGQDDRGNTASSEVLSIAVIAPGGKELQRPAAGSEPPAPVKEQGGKVVAQAVTPTPIVSEEGGPDPTATPAPTQEPTAAPTEAPTATEAPAATAAPAPTIVMLATAVPTAVSTTEESSSPATVAPQLPDTAASAPAAGLSLGLLGFALVIHGTRRVRRFSVGLERVETVGLQRLARESAELQRQTVESSEQMAAQGERLADLLEDLRRE